jgi:hypothetical protein
VAITRSPLRSVPSLTLPAAAQAERHGLGTGLLLELPAAQQKRLGADFARRALERRGEREMDHAHARSQ